MKELSAEEAAEVSQLWRKLVKLFHPDRFAQEPEKQETYHKLTAAMVTRAFQPVPVRITGWKARVTLPPSARSARSRNCAACGRASSWKSSVCSKRSTSSRRAPITNCTG